MKSNETKSGLIKFAAFVAIIVVMYGISEIILNYSPQNSESDYYGRVSNDNSYDESSNPSEANDTHREDDYIGYSLDMLCNRRNGKLGDDKIFMNDDAEEYSGAFIDCETYFDILKQYGTLYVIDREEQQDTRMSRQDFNEYVEDRFSYYLFTVADKDVANARGVRLRE